MWQQKIDTRPKKDDFGRHNLDYKGLALGNLGKNHLRRVSSWSYRWVSLEDDDPAAFITGR